MVSPDAGQTLWPLMRHSSHTPFPVEPVGSLTIWALHNFWQATPSPKIIVFVNNLLYC